MLLFPPKWHFHVFIETQYATSICPNKSDSTTNNVVHASKAIRAGTQKWYVTRIHDMQVYVHLRCCQIMDL